MKLDVFLKIFRKIFKDNSWNLMSFSGYLRNNFWYYTKLADNFFRLFSLWLFPPYGDKDVRVHVEQAEKGQNSRCQCGVPYQWYGVPLYGKICCLLWEFPSKLVSSVRSSNSHPDLLLTQHPLFQITPVLNTGLSLSEPLQLYQRQSLHWTHLLAPCIWV